MNQVPFHSRVCRKAVWGPKRIVWGLFLLFIWLAPSLAGAATHSTQPAKKPAGAPGSAARFYKLDSELSRRANVGNPAAFTRVIVTLVPGAVVPIEFKRFAIGGRLDLINGQVLDLPNGVLKQLAAHPSVFQVHYDRPTKAHNYRTAVTVGARTVQQTMGFTGTGIGVAILDSGISTWHDDLTNTTAKLFPYGNQRVAKFVDFVNSRALPYDDNGHGTHVAGIIGGNGYDSRGEKAGIAPDASLISLKVLDQEGKGTISSIIAALGWVANNSAAYNIRVVNLSIGARITESYWTDPLTRACKLLTDKGIVVVVAAGNFGKNVAGNLQWGGITAPGNAPWVLTVGASSTMGTLTRNDDTMAAFSSSGPSRLDFEAKPDLVAPGTGTISLATPGSTLFTLKAQYLLDGKLKLGSKPYLALSGTSMAAPVVSGTVALMLQANPTLTPNLVKALLQYTAQVYPGYSSLRQGAGFLNTLGAVRLAQYYRAPKAGDKMPTQKVWSKRIIWGSHKLTGFIKPTANAWANTVIWGSAKTMGMAGDNIVWGTMCAGECGDNIVWGTSADGDNIVWGSDCGGADCDNIVWGTADGDNIVWGTADSGDNIVWGTFDGDNIVWGTSDEDPADAVIYPDDAVDPLPSIDLEFGDTVPLKVTSPTVSTGIVSIGG
jgi:subtilisin family serine protease